MSDTVMKKRTIRELAEELHLSPAAVSMALNNKPGVSNATRARVQAHIQKNGYIVSRQKAKRKGVLTMAFVQEGDYRFNDNLLFSSLVAGVQSAAEKLEYDVSVQFLSRQGLQEYQPRTDGTVFLGTLMTEEDLQLLSRVKYHFVILDRDAGIYPMDSIAIDNAYGVCTGFRHLVEKGHSSIGYVRCVGIELHNYAERFEAYQNCLHRFHIEAADVIELPSNMSMACSAMNEHLEKRSLQATALLCDNEQIACAAITALNSRGLQVGKNISLVCFDNSFYAENAGLTAIDVPFFQMGREAVLRLLNRLENPEEAFAHSRIGTKLIVRESVAMKN